MSKLGGYQIVNFADVNLTDTGVTFKGLYGRLFKDIGKPVLLSGVVLFNQSYQDCYVQPVYTLEGFKMTVGDYTVTVTVDDLVLATYGIIGGGGSGSDIPPLNPDGAGEVLTNIGSETMGWVPNHDVPSGGLSGQVLTKASNADYALQWRSTGVQTPYILNLSCSEDINQLTDSDSVTLSNGTYSAIASASEGGVQGDCYPFRVQLRDSSGSIYKGSAFLTRSESLTSPGVLVFTGIVNLVGVNSSQVPDTMFRLALKLQMPFNTATSGKPSNYVGQYFKL